MFGPAASTPVRRPVDPVRAGRSWLNENAWRAIGALLVIPALMYLPLARARWAMIALAPLVATFNVVVNALVSRGRHRAAWLSLFGFAAIVLTSRLVPQLWVPSMVLLTANTAFTTRWMGRRYAVAGVVLSVGLLALSAASDLTGDAIGTICLWAFSAACTIGIIGDARIEADRRIGEYANLVESVALGMVIVKADHAGVIRVQAINPAMARYLTIDPELLVGTPAAEAFGHAFDTAALDVLRDVAAGGGPVDLGPTKILNDAVHYVRIRVFPLQAGSAAITVEDATAWHLATSALAYQTNHDVLTGLPNRPNVLKQLEDALDDAYETGGQVSVAIIDVDRFRKINDVYGHHEADRLLIELGMRLSTVSADLIGRVGEDEFAVVLTGANTALRADDLAEELLRRFREPIEVQGVPVQLTAAVGISTYPTNASEAAELVQRAELAMYQAKTHPNRVTHYDLDDRKPDAAEISLLNDFRRSLCSGEFTTEYQPIVELATGRIVGAETLVRWQHPERGLLLPGEFLDLAERLGMVEAVTESVAAAAIADAARWQRAGYPVSVTINLAEQALQNHRIVAQLLHLLDLADLPGSLLRVEVTEQSLMRNQATATAVLDELRNRGAEVSIDDFGTGYSSLALLGQMPIDELKIDGSFVHELAPQDAGLVRSIIDLGHALGLRVVAEGIETQRACDALTDYGCDRGQGWYLGRPMDSEQFLALLQPPQRVVGPARKATRPTNGGLATVTSLQARRASH